MIKAAFFDVDGTLLSYRTGRVPTGTREAIEKLQQKGIACIVATGRHISQLEKLPVADIPFDAYLTLNGQLMLDREKRVLFGSPITGKSRDFLVKAFDAHTFPAVMVEENQLYMNYVTEHVRTVSRDMAITIPPLSDYRGGAIYQVCAYLRPGEEQLLAPIAQECVITGWNYGGKDIVAKGGGKMAGIRRYLEETGILQEEIIAFGDAENDLEMVRFAGIGVAMGNGVEAVKAAANFVTADIDDDGIEKALRHYRLI